MLHLMVIYLTWMARQITIFVIIHRSMSKVKWVDITGYEDKIQF